MVKSDKSKNMKAIEMAKALKLFLKVVREKEKDLTNLGSRFSKKSAIGKIERAKSIIYTAGNSYTNNFHIANLSMLQFHLEEKFYHKETIRDDLIRVKQAFYWALGGNAQIEHKILWDSLRELIKYTDIEDKTKN